MGRISQGHGHNKNRFVYERSDMGHLILKVGHVSRKCEDLTNHQENSSKQQHDCFPDRNSIMISSDLYPDIAINVPRLCRIMFGPGLAGLKILT